MEVCNIKQKNDVQKIESIKIQIDQIKKSSINCNDMNMKSDKFDDKKQILKAILNDFEKDSFKMPNLIADSQKMCQTKFKTFSHNISEKIFKNREHESNSNQKSKIRNLINKVEKSVILEESKKEKEFLFSYIEPIWSGRPKDIYKLEVLKSGMILETIDLSKKNYHVIGRLPACDISLAHPTISRYHAILQFRIVENEENKKGFYIYDLESTHGTFWNGNRIKSKFYVHLQGGHIIRFGCSQRKFILQAPLDDQEQESDYSATELKKKKLELIEKERLVKQQLFKQAENERLIKAKQENEGIDWGMGEDADEETDLTENPYAQTSNEELFLDDPKKTLRGWFEREGYDLQYKTEDKGIGRFLCYVDLPIDHSTERTIRAEAIIAGKKKEAVLQCALEACRILDRHGLLRQSNHEARKKKSRNWEEEDYYDSDEDNFLDRTGIIERKREQRMRLAGKLDLKVETYNSLLEKHLKVTENILHLENEIILQKSKQDKTDDSNTDALDAYMSILESSTLNQTTIREMKMDLFNLRKEEVQLLKLINVTKPVELPALEPCVPRMITKFKNDFKGFKSVIRQKKKLKSSLKKCETISKLIEENIDIIKEYNKEKLEEPQENKLVKHEINHKQTIENNKNLDKNNLKNKKNDLKQNELKKKNKSKFQIDYYDEDKFKEDYNMWFPPENQSGDGKTILNKKFGY